MRVILFGSQAFKWGRYLFVSQSRALQPGELLTPGSLLTAGSWAFPLHLPASGKANTWNHFREHGRKCPRPGGQDLVTALAFGINELQDDRQATTGHAEPNGPTAVGLNPDPAVAQRHGTVHLASLKLGFLLGKTGVIFPVYVIKLHDSSLRQEFGR